MKTNRMGVEMIWRINKNRNIICEICRGTQYSEYNSNSAVIQKKKDNKKEVTIACKIILIKQKAGPVTQKFWRKLWQTC